MTDRTGEFGADLSDIAGSLLMAAPSRTAPGWHAGFLNAGSVISTDGADGLHLSAESERKLGTAIAEKVKEMLK